MKKVKSSKILAMLMVATLTVTLASDVMALGGRSSSSSSSSRSISSSSRSSTSSRSTFSSGSKTSTSSSFGGSKTSSWFSSPAATQDVYKFKPKPVAVTTLTKPSTPTPTVSKEVVRLNIPVKTIAGVAGTTGIAATNQLTAFANNANANANATKQVQPVLKPQVTLNTISIPPVQRTTTVYVQSPAVAHTIVMPVNTHPVYVSPTVQPITTPSEGLVTFFKVIGIILGAIVLFLLGKVVADKVFGGR